MSESSQITKIPPQDIEAEKSVLGAVLIDSSAMNSVAEFLKAEHFYLPEHKIIFEAMTVSFEKQKPIDLVTIQDELKKDGSLKKIGGKSYLSDLINTVPTSAYIEHYGRIVKDQFTKRKLIEISSRLVTKSFDEKGDVKKLIDQAYKAAREVIENNKDKLQAIADTLLKCETLDAAEVIHSDIKKGFIRAEVVSFKDLMDAGTYPEARKKGTVRLEGKTYCVQDGDIINFRFNV